MKTEITLKDLRINTYHPRNFGGWVLKNANGVRITHVPTGLSAECHDDRSVHRNRLNAFRMLELAIANEPVPRVKFTHGGTRFEISKQPELWGVENIVVNSRIRRWEDAVLWARKVTSANAKKRATARETASVSISSIDATCGPMRHVPSSHDLDEVVAQLSQGEQAVCLEGEWFRIEVIDSGFCKLHPIKDGLNYSEILTKGYNVESIRDTPR